MDLDQLDAISATWTRLPKSTPWLCHSLTSPSAVAARPSASEAEQELRLRAELLDLAHDAVIVREPAESRVTFWNREAEAIYGYSREEAIGSVTHELLATVFPESREAVDDALAREGQWVGELRHTRKDGARDRRLQPPGAAAR